MTREKSILQKFKESEMETNNNNNNNNKQNSYLEFHIVQVYGVCISAQVDNIPVLTTAQGNIGIHLHNR
jgi:hypothetical protein